MTGLIKLNTTTGRHGDCGVVSVGKEAHNTLHDHCMTISILFVLDTSLDNSSKRKCQNIIDKYPDLQTNTFKCSVEKCGITVVGMTVHA